MNELADLLERYRRGAELLAVATTGAAGPELDFKPDGKWSVRPIVCHLADAEAVAVMRFRQFIAEDNPTFGAWDQDAWASKLGYEKRKISQALETFRMLRFGNYELLRDQPPEAFERGATHSKRGAVTMRQFLQLFAEHAENHARQIQGVRAAFREHKAKQAAQAQ
jgi:hypothetical protein